MLKKIFFVLSFLLVWENGFSQVPDATFVLHQNMLNAFLSAVGPVSGTSSFRLLGVKGSYTWTLSNARIELKQGQARFLADANIKAGPISYSAPAAGDVEVRYDPEANRIRIKVLQAIFEVYTKIFGKKIHITNVDAAEFYRPEFEFAGPKPVQPSVSVKLPDGNIKTLYIIPVSQDLRVEEHKIIVTSSLVFSNQRPHNVQGEH